ncbi:MAG: SDR family oxidoreductase [Spirochaetota bacterium]
MLKERFKDKVAIITGGASGLGEATAKMFADEGGKPVISDVSEDKGNEVLNAIKDKGGDAIFVKCDVSNADDVKAMLYKTIDTYGRLDYAFNNAGIGGPQKATADYTEEEWTKVIDINLKGVWLCMKYEIPHMLKQVKSSIVNCSSILGHVGFQAAPAYVASKHGLIGLTKTAAIEYSSKGLRVNAICPAFIKTPLLKGLPGDMLNQLKQMHPIGRLGEPEEVAAYVLWLFSDEASFVTGQAPLADGAYTSQ